MDPRNNLPKPLSSFIGRKREIRQVRTLVAGARLLTLIGPGGSGKSRLALEAARGLTERYRDGVFGVELAPLVEARLVSRSVALALDVPEQPGRPLLATLSDHLRLRNVLLVLDNCEQVAAEVAATVDALLRVCPELHMLATSRVALDITGERTWSVPQLESAESLALLAERGADASAGFIINPDNEATAREICRRVDGMPLAIELAAARLKALSLDEVAARLDDRFRLLTGGSRAALPRHRTLRATMEWSYDLLPGSSRLLWRRLAVFSGGFELEAAEAVCSDRLLEQHQILDHLTALVDNSVLQVGERHGIRRFHMLETVREYGALKLEETGETAELRRRHLQWFLELAIRAEPEWRGSNQRRWLDRLGEDLDNIRAALEFSRSDDTLVGDGLRLASGLWLFWHRHHIGESRQWLASLLDRAGPGRPRAYALNVAGFMAYVQGETSDALPLLRESLRLNRALDDRANTNLSLLRLGIALYYNNDLDEAVDVLDQALSRYRELGDRVGIYVSAYELAEALTMRGDHDRARGLYEESLALKVQQGDAWHIALSYFGMGLLAWLQGDHRQAVTTLRECLQLRQDLDEWWGLGKSLEALAWVEGSRGHLTKAAHLLGASAAMHERMSVKLSPNYQVHHNRCVATIRAEMSQDPFQAALVRGHGLSAPEAVAYALRDRVLGAPKREPRGRVTAREAEIAVLVATGLTNRQIARKLSLAERTVDSHLEHIMNKLGHHSRAQVAAWAATGGDFPR